jgi:integrase
MGLKMQINKVFTDSFIKTFKATEGRVLKADGGMKGLILEVMPSGTKFFRFRYKFDGNRKMMTLGEYPALSLKTARQYVNDARELLASNTDPIEAKKKAKEGRLTQAEASQADRKKQSFKQAYDAFCKFKTTVFGDNKPTWNYKTLKKHNERFSNYVLPIMGARLLEDLTEVDLEECLLAIQAHGTLSNRDKVRTVLNGLFGWAYGQRYAHNQERWISRNVSKYISDDVFHKHASKQYKHLTEPKEIKELLVQLGDLRATLEVKTAVQLAVHIFVRPSNVVGMRWEQVDFEEGVIRYHLDEMKMDKAFILPMSQQVVAMLKEIEPLTGHSDYVFLSPRGSAGKPISRDSLSNSFRRNGIVNVQPHGLRHTASTALNNLGFNGDVIELSLAHVTGGVRGIYNKSDRLEQRKELMGAWSDYLEGLRIEADVVATE